MQNSEAVQAWFQGKMASFRILGLVSKNEIRSREFSFLSRSLRVKIINLDLVSMPEIGGNFFSVSSRSLSVSVRNSRSRLDERDWIGETLILVSRLKKRLSLTTDLRYIQKGRPSMKYLKFYQSDHWSVLWLTSSSFLPCPLKSWLTPAMPAAFTIALKKHRINLFCCHYEVKLQKFSYLDVELRWRRFEDDIWLKLGP